MKVTHVTNDGLITSNVKLTNQKFTLTSSNGTFYTQNIRGIQDSRYNGLYSKSQGTFIKTLESISSNGEVSEIELYDNAVKIKKESLDESYSLINDSIVYEARGKGLIRIKVDYKELFNNSIKVKPELISINGYKVLKFNDLMPYHLVIATNAKLIESVNEESLHYPLDSLRNSPPHSREVTAVYEIKLESPVRIVLKPVNDFNQGLKLIHDSLRMKLEFNPVKEPSLNALNKLIFNERVIAGLPWFFKAWPRDELISIKALIITKQAKLVKSILMNYYKLIPKNGLFSLGDAINACSTGLLAKRTLDYLDYNGSFNKSEEELIIRNLKEAVNNILKCRASDGLIINQPKETWMDTIMRDGPRIEIQALQLKIYELLGRLTREPKYLVMYNELKNKVRQLFFKGALKDSPSDDTVRPNVFLAYYYCPEILNRSEWLETFKQALNELWLPWGGLASVSRNSHLFRAVDDGEQSLSYHNGDSWYFINNISAICMSNFPELISYSKDIYNASMNDLLFQGSLGDSSEISDANNQESRGAWAQAWSAGTLIELRALVLKKLIPEDYT